MSTDNVTPIRAKPGRSKAPPRDPRAPKGFYLLTDPPDGPSTLHLIQALIGICAACEATAEDASVDQLQLATAGRILSTMLEERMS